MASGAVGCARRDMAASLGLSTTGALAGIRSVVAGITPAGGDRRVTHRIGRETRCRVGVAVAALDPSHRNVRRRGLAGRGGAVVAARAIGVGRRVNVGAPSPAGKGRCRAGVTGDAVAAVGGDVTGERCRALRALGALAGIGPVVAGIAAAGADRAVIHGVGREARRGIVVAVAALDPRHRHMRRRRQAGRGGAVVAARAIGIGRRVNVGAARPTGKGRGRAGVTRDAVAAVGGDVTGERRRALAHPWCPGWYRSRYGRSRSG